MDTSSTSAPPVWRCTNGNITREESGEIVLIAKVDDNGKVAFESDELEKKFRLSVIAKLRKWGLVTEFTEQEPEQSVQGQSSDGQEQGHEDPEEGSIAEPIDNDEPELSQGPRSTGALTVEQRKAVQRLRRELGFPVEVEKNSPPEPPMTNYGDKDKAFVEWLLRYHPEEFAVKYGIIGEGSVSISERVYNSTTKTWRKVKKQVEGVLSERKIHLTYKPVKLSSIRRRR